MGHAGSTARSRRPSGSSLRPFGSPTSQAATTSSDASLHFVRGCGHIVVLPHAYRLPPDLSETGVRVTIPSAVRLELPPPELSVSAGERGVLRAHVPKAAIDEDGDFLVREDEVGSTAAVDDELPLETEPEPTAVQLRAQSDLWRRVGTAGTTHPSADSGRRRDGPRLIVRSCGFAADVFRRTQ